MMIIAIVLVTITTILQLVTIINNNQVIWLNKLFLNLFLKVFKLLVFINVSGIWFQNKAPTKDKAFWPVFVFRKGRLTQ